MPTNYNGIKKSICYRNPFNHPSVAFRIKAVNKVGGYEDVPFFEDWFLWAKMISSNANVANIDKSLVKFRFSDQMVGEGD